MHDLSKNFLKELETIDRDLRALYDDREDSIFISALRQGLKVHELTVKRQFAENYDELEHRTLSKLRASDVWNKYGTGKAYDDFLAEEEEKFRDRNKKKAKSEHLAKVKEDRELWRAAIWNAQHGRFTRETAIPYQTASFSFAGAVEKQNGFTVTDKRVRITEPINDLKGQKENV
jgi:hypothetical protein